MAITGRDLLILKRLKNTCPTQYKFQYCLLYTSEVTVDSPDAFEMITKLRKIWDGKLYIGAGTITDEDRCARALEAGAQFVVAPNYHPGVVSLCQKKMCIRDSGYGLNQGWSFGNQLISYAWETVGTDDYYEEMKAFNESAVTSKAVGFIFDSSPVKSEVAALDSVRCV